MGVCTGIVILTVYNFSENPVKPVGFAFFQICYPHQCPEEYGKDHCLSYFRALMWITVVFFMNNGYSLKIFFSILHKSIRAFRFFVCWTDCLWLVNGKTFHQPAEFLSGKRPYLGRIPWPLKFSITVQSFIKKTETILVKIQCFQGIATSSTKKIKCICIGIHLVCVPDDRHQTIYTASHIRSTCLF